jgi:hypothetical protein
MAAAHLAVRGWEKICWRGGYRLRSVVSVQAEEGVKIQAEQPNKGGMQSEDWGMEEGQENVWDWSAMEDMDPSLVMQYTGPVLARPGPVRDPTPAKIYPGAM